MVTRVLALTRYGNLGASSRLRISQYIPKIIAYDIKVINHPLLPDKILSLLYLNGGYGLLGLMRAYVARIIVLIKLKKFDLLWIEKEALPWFPVWFELLLLKKIPFILDLDDAIFHVYDLHKYRLVRFFLKRRIDYLMARSSYVICGNKYLAQRAKNAGALHVEIIPTVVDLERYPIFFTDIPLYKTNLKRIVWVGSPSTVDFLSILKDPLLKLARKHQFIFRVIGANFICDGLNIECMTWSEDTEVALISECDFGVMPLPRSPWTLGKCGYKLIQYMACKLPVIASPVGINTEIVIPRVNGFLAESSDDWEKAIEKLLTDQYMCENFGRAGRERVESFYSLQSTVSKMAKIIQTSSGQL